MYQTHIYTYVYSQIVLCAKVWETRKYSIGKISVVFFVFLSFYFWGKIFSIKFGIIPIIIMYEIARNCSFAKNIHSTADIIRIADMQESNEKCSFKN